MRAMAIMQPDLEGLLDGLTHEQRTAQRWEEYSARALRHLRGAHPDAARRLSLSMATTMEQPKWREASVWLSLCQGSRFEHYVEHAATAISA